MAYSMIQFYGGDHFLQYHKNFAIDDLETFLNSYKIGSPVQFQYIKHALDLTIKINLGEAYQAPAVNIDYYKYVSITNENEAPLYYYVFKAEVVSESSIRLTLRLDTINSMLTANTPRRLSFNERTKVTREHQDRFYPSEGTAYHQKRIPLLSEGITPILYKNESVMLDFLEAGSYASKNWYLIYKTEYTEETKPAGTPNPVKMYLLNDDPIITQAATPTTQYILNKDILINRYQGYKTLAFTPHEGNSGTITIGSTSYSLNDYDALIFLRNANNVNLWTLYALRGGNTIDSVALSTQNAVFSGSWTYGAFMSNDLQTSSNKFVINNSYEIHYKIENSDNKLNVDIYAALQTIPFNQLDRTDSRLIKIVCLPYCPIKYTITNGAFVSDTPFTLKDGLIALDQNVDFDVNLSKTALPNYHGTFNEAGRNINPQENQARNIKDSKLLHSDYFIKKYVYDSFTYTLKFENLFNSNLGSSFNAIEARRTYLKYFVSNGVTSRFMFDIRPVFSGYIEDQDYDFIIYVSRNNEIATFDAAYINYLRTGYNVDVKNKNRQEATTWITTALGVGATIAGIATGNALLTAGAVTSTLASLTGAISSTISAETNIQAKRDQLQAQKASVINADDVSLLIKYSKNKVKIETWTASEQVLKLLDDLFYYTGYLTNEYKAPTHNNRLYFDFLACEPIYNNVYNWADDMIADVTLKLNEGVTFLHNVNGVYNIDQTLENWENSLFIRRA